MKDLWDLPHVYRELARTEAELAQQEELARQAVEDAAEASRIATEDQGISQASSLINTLVPLYNRRAEMAEKLAPILADLWNLERSIRVVEVEALGILTHTRGCINSPAPLERLNDLRKQAGLPNRVDLQLPEPRNEAEDLARTVLYGIYSRCLTPGTIAVGGRYMSLKFNR